jgi:SNF2 family DNA or RNA helicase
MRFDQARDVFLDRHGNILFAADLLSFEEELLSTFPEVDLSPSYWDIGFSYKFLNEGDGILDLVLILRNMDIAVEIPAPNYLYADYFCNSGTIFPIRDHDFQALNNFLPTLDHDGIAGLTIKELMNFDYFASTNGFVVENADYKDRVLSNSNVRLSQFENVLTVDPYPYQAIGIEWLRSQQSLGRHGAILGDVMGLGKTLQAIGLLTHNLRDGKGDNLVICPGTLIENWRREINKFSPELKALVHNGPLRAGTAARIKGYDAVITSYDVVVRDIAMLITIDWNVVVLDEAQAIKNPDAKRTIRTKSLPRQFGLAISGTPMENRLLDLWSLSDFADPALFGSQAKFENDYESSPSGATEAGKILRSILLRRRLTDIEHQLPEKTVIDHPLQWPPELNDVYESVRIEALNEFAVSGGLVATGRLRKLTTHPLLMDINLGGMTDLSPKYLLALEIIDELFQNNEKCLVFASYKRMIDLIANDISLKYGNAFVSTLDGRTAIEERTPLVDEFNAFDGPGVLVCNPIVAGAGLNITGANHVIHYNLEWNPAKEDQATFRVFRNGQLKKTFIHRLFYVNTIDEVIDQRIQIKRTLSDLSVDGSVTEDDYFAGLQITPVQSNND